MENLVGSLRDDSLCYSELGAIAHNKGVYLGDAIEEIIVYFRLGDSAIRFAADRS